MKLQRLIIGFLVVWFVFGGNAEILAQDAASETENQTATAPENHDLEDGEYEEGDTDDPEVYDAAYLSSVGDRISLDPVLSELEFYATTESRLTIAPEDMERLRNGEVDVRVTDYLLSLVRPAELGGYGFTHIKVGRLFKNYSSNGVGRFDRETGNPEDEDRSVSTHHRGQAVDISEVGAIKCKLVERRRVGGSTTRWQAPKPIKVAWQSVDGIARHPTPKSPSLMETAGVMSADSILRMLNESGEFDHYADYVRGLDLTAILTYVGANLLLKGMGATKITSDPLIDNLIQTLGAAMIEQHIGDLPNGLIAQQDQEIAGIAVTRARIEEELNLPPGTLRGNGWEEALKNAGKRSLENALGLPTLFLEDHQLSEVTALETVRAALGHFARGDAAFDFIDGAIDKIQKNDEQGLVLAGVNVIATALNLTDRQKAELEAAARQDRTPSLRTEDLAVNKTISLATLPLFFSDNPAEQREALAAAEELGKKFLAEALQKQGLKSYGGIASDIYSRVVGGERISVREMFESIGAKKLELDYDLKVSDVRLLSQSGRIGQGEVRIAEELNKQYGLQNDERITSEDVDKALGGRDLTLVKKIGGSEADKVFGWNNGTGYAILSGQKKFDEAVTEIFSNAFGQVLGLNSGTEVSLSGDIHKNYGLAFLKQTLGLTFDKAAADQFPSEALLAAFGLPTSRDLKTLREDRDFWLDPDIFGQLARVDARVGAPSGTSERYLKGELSTDDFARRVAVNRISNVAVDQLWNFFDLEDQFRLSRDDTQLLFDVLTNWDNAGFEKKDQFFKLIPKLVGRVLDSRTNFDIDSFAQFFTNPSTENAVKLLLEQGVRQLAISFGVNLEDFDPDDLEQLTERIVKVFNGTASALEREQLVNQLIEATNIPEGYQKDIEAFMEGDFRTMLASWSAVIWSEFANKYLPEEGRLSFEEMRHVFRYDDEAAITARADALVAESGATSLTPEEYEAIRTQARRELAQEARDNAQFKISDALIEQALGQEIPVDFSRRMMTGSSAERAEMLMDFGFAQLDAVLAGIEPSYQEGTLKKIYEGTLSAEDADRIVLSIISRSGVDFGPFDATFVSQFYQFIRGQGRQDFFTNPDYSNMWSYLDSWLQKTLGIGDLPADLSRSLFFASKNGWRLDASLTGANGQITVPSLAQIGEAFLINKLSLWGDKQFGLPAGSVYQIYQAAQSVQSASRALAVAKAAGDAAKATQAAASLSKAQAELTAIVVTIALNACDACQQFFASIDEAIAAPPGFTNMAVSGAIAMALGLGPAGLIAAAVVYFVGVYRVDYLCPAPPPDIFAITIFDPSYDQIDYTWGEAPNKLSEQAKRALSRTTQGQRQLAQRLAEEERYREAATNQLDPATVKDVPAPGENPFDWDDNVAFTDGNDPDLWRAWARYNTGKLLDVTMKYGQERVRPNKPKQIITLRRANAEFFFDRIPATFGTLATIFPSVGLGYTQTTTKTTDWVHVAFGGFF